MRPFLRVSRMYHHSNLQHRSGNLLTGLITVPAGGDYGNITVTDPCNICLIMNLKFQAESPYYAGPDIYSSSLYQSKTSSCGVSGMPLTTTSETIYTYVP